MYTLHADSSCLICRDLKLANWLFTKDGRIILADFGLGKKQVAKKQRQSIGVGTMNMMAPEQCVGKGIYDSSVDVWGYGMVLLELCDDEPFKKLSDAQIAEMWKQLEMEEAQGLIDEMVKPLMNAAELQPVAELLQVIQGCLRVNPAERIEWGDILDKLSTLSESLAVPRDGRVRIQSVTPCSVSPCGSSMARGLDDELMDGAMSGLSLRGASCSPGFGSPMQMESFDASPPSSPSPLQYSPASAYFDDATGQQWCVVCQTYQDPADLDYVHGSYHCSTSCLSSRRRQ